MENHDKLLEEEKHKHNKFKIFIIIFIIGSLILFKEENQKIIVEKIKSINVKEKNLELVYSFSNEEDILDLNIYDDRIVKWNNNKISILNLDGTKIIDKDFNFEKPSIYYGKHNIYPMDKSTGDIYSLDNTGETINRLRLDKEIFNFEELNENIIYHEKSPELETINILDKEKVEIGKYSYENKNILSYSINEKETKSVIGVIEVDEEGIKSHLDVYGKKNEKLNEININGEIVVYLKITDRDEIIVLTDSGIHFIKKGEILWTKKLNLIKDIYIKDENIYVLHSNYLETINFKGDTKDTVGFTEEYKKMYPFRNGTLLYGDKHMVMAENGKIVLKKEENIIGLYTSGDKILVWGPEEIKTYRVDF